MKGPEQLCQHMEEYHEARDVMEEKEFATGQELEHWLNRIEEGRSEGGVLGSDEEKAEDDTVQFVPGQDTIHILAILHPMPSKVHSPAETTPPGNRGDGLERVSHLLYGRCPHLRENG